MTRQNPYVLKGHDIIKLLNLKNVKAPVLIILIKYICV